MRQHVTDPVACIQCSACEMACPVRAIQCIGGRFCIDFELCKYCKKCIDDCPTGAVDCELDVEAPFSVLEQSQWQEVPLPMSKMTG